MWDHHFTPICNVICCHDHLGCAFKKMTTPSVVTNVFPSLAGAPSGLTRRVINSTSVEISWRAEQYLPPTVTLQHYTISAHNTSDPRSPQQLQTVVEEGAPDDSGVYSRVFNFDRELSPCSQITFSVTSTSYIGTSLPSNVTWEMPLAGS